MPKVDFSDAFIKLERAKKHIADVEAEIASYLSSDFYALRVETNNGTNTARVLLDSLHEPSKQLNALIGDAIGNLRSVLDYATVAMYYPITGSRDITFPFADDGNGFENSIKKGPVNVLAAPVLDFMVNEMQCYKGGKGEAVWALNKLRNIDKHRLLITVAQLAGVRTDFRAGSGTITNYVFTIRAGDKNGGVIQAPADQLQFTSQPQAVFKVKINEPPHVPDTEVLGLLKGAHTRLYGYLKELDVIV